MALLTGIDLSFFKDDGFKKFVVILAYMEGIIIFGVKGLITPAVAMEQLGIAAGAYVVINLGSRTLAGIQAARETKADAEAKK